MLLLYDDDNDNDQSTTNECNFVLRKLDSPLKLVMVLMYVQCTSYIVRCTVYAVLNSVYVPYVRYIKLFFNLKLLVASKAQK